MLLLWLVLLLLLTPRLRSHQDGITSAPLRPSVPDSSGLGARPRTHMPPGRQAPPAHLTTSPCLPACLTDKLPPACLTHGSAMWGGSGRRG